MNDDHHHAILNFLTDGLPIKERDIITRSYFGVAQGDPQSAPVQIAVVFTACIRKLAQAPAEIRDANANLQWMLEEAKKLEHRMIERTGKLNANVIAVFKDEAARVSSSLRTTHQLNEATLKEAREMVRTTEAVNVHAEGLATTLRLLHNDFQEHNLSVRKIAEATTSTGISIEAIKEIIGDLKVMSAANWITIGIGIGFILTGTAIETDMPWWGRVLIFAGPIGLLQLIAGDCWKGVKKEAETMKTTS